PGWRCGVGANRACRYPVEAPAPIEWKASDGKGSAVWRRYARSRRGADMALLYANCVRKAIGRATGSLGRKALGLRRSKAGPSAADRRGNRMQTGFKPACASVAREGHQALPVRVPELEPQAAVHAGRTQGRYPRRL